MHTTHRRSRLATAALALTALALAACASGDDSSATSTSATSTSATSTSATSTISTSAPATTAAPAPSASLQPPADPAGVVTHAAIMVGGIERTYRLYVPSKLPDAPVALFIALHGGTGWGDQFAQTDHIESLAESNGFVVVHPDGVKVQGGPGGAWNAGACCGAPARDGVDDVAFVAALVDAMEARFTIDPTRVFAIGHSNGAMMSFRLACDLSDRITGIGMWAGSLETDSCTPTHPVSIIQGHGDADMNIPLAGGDGSEGIADVDFTPPHDGFVRIADAAGCPAGSTSTTGDITTEERSPCAEGAAAEFVTIHTATHTWPESAALRTPASGPAYQGWDATAQIVAFLLAHPRAG